MSDIWDKVIEFMKQIAGHPALQRFAEEVRRSALEHLIAWLQDALKARHQGGLAAA